MKKALALITWASLSKLLFGYLDPGTGSLIIQLIVGGIVGLLVVFRSSVSSVLYMLGLRKPSTDDIDDIENIEDENLK